MDRTFIDEPDVAEPQTDSEYRHGGDPPSSRAICHHCETVIELQDPPDDKDEPYPDWWYHVNTELPECGDA